MFEPRMPLSSCTLGVVGTGPGAGGVMVPPGTWIGAGVTGWSGWPVSTCPIPGMSASNRQQAFAIEVLARNTTIIPHEIAQKDLVMVVKGYCPSSWLKRTE